MLISAIFIIFCTSYATGVQVEIPDYGTVIGTEEESRGHVTFYAFRGIPYAKAPKDELRFRDPQKPNPWGILEAKKFSNKCIQLNPGDPRKTIGDEDCLYLNVYTPTVNPNANLAVMVWIHGGAFIMGASGSFEPHYLMDKHFVFVTFNYRLNALGFLHLDDEFLPGNWGMKDQVAALEWVQDFIYLFGGNKKKVTIAGSSSGSAAVNWHMYSPRSKGLFQQAICQSGTAKSIWAEIPRHVAQKRAEAIATMAGCVYESIAENVKCLRRIPADELVLMQTRFHIWRGNPYAFGPVIESPNSENPFITVSPWKSKPHTEQMPLLTGLTSDEGAFFYPGFLRNQGEGLDLLGENYRRLLPVVLTYQFNLDLESEDELFYITEEIRKHYFKQLPINKSTFPQIKQMLAESQVVYDTIVTIKQYEFRQYFYIYSHKNEHTFAELEKPNFLDVSGPAHSDELLSLFKLENIFRGAEDLNEADLKVSNLVINLWTGFIIESDPNFYSHTGLEWSPVKNGEELNFYNINVQPSLGVFQWEELYKFWEGIRWHVELSKIQRRKAKSLLSTPISKI